MLSFGSIVLFRGNQTALPSSRALFVVTAALYLAISTGLLEITNAFYSNLLNEPITRTVPMLNTLGMNFFTLILDASLIYILLRVFNLQARAYKTIFAAIGINVVFLAGMALTLQIFNALSPLLAFIPILAIGIWGYCVHGNILAVALDTRLSWGVVAAILMSIVSGVITLWIFGSPATFDTSGGIQ